MSAQPEVLAVSLNPATLVKDAFKEVVGGFLASIGKAFANMAADLAGAVFGFAAQKSSIDLNKDYFVRNYNVVFGIPVLVVIAIFLCACIMAALRGDPHMLPRATAATATAVLGSFFALTLLDMVLRASDGMAEALGSGQPLGGDLVEQLRALPARGNFALDIVLSLLVALFSFALFVVLYVRKIAILAVALFIPLYLAGQPAGLTRGWIKRAVEVLAALTLAKPVIYGIFVLGAGLASDGNGSAADQTLAVLGGIVVMVAAIFTPFALLYIIGFAHAQVIGALASAVRQSGRAAASFGHGLGASLGASSRETFRGIGERLQSRRSGGLPVPAHASRAILGAGAAGAASALAAGRPGRRTGTAMPTTPVRTPARTGARAAGRAGAGSAGRAPGGEASGRVVPAQGAGRSVTRVLRPTGAGGRTDGAGSPNPAPVALPGRAAGGGTPVPLTRAGSADTGRAPAPQPGPPPAITIRMRPLPPGSGGQLVTAGREAP